MSGTVDASRACDNFTEHHWKKGLCRTCRGNVLAHQLRKKLNLKLSTSGMSLNDRSIRAAPLKTPAALVAPPSSAGDDTSTDSTQTPEAPPAQDDGARNHHVRGLVIDEILSTERNYVEGLRMVQELYLLPLQSVVAPCSASDLGESALQIGEADGSPPNNATLDPVDTQVDTALSALEQGNQESRASGIGRSSSPGGRRDSTVDESKRILTAEEIATLFSNMQLITELNNNFLKELEQEVAAADTSAEASVGHLFVKFAPFFKMYTQYCSNHERASDHLARFLKRPAFAAFCDQCTTDPRCKGAPLSSFLILPIQRIPRYNLLLRELQKRSGSCTAEVQKVLADALHQVEAVAMFINNAVRTREDNDRLLAIQSQFIDGAVLVEAGRIFCRHGTLSKVGRRSTKENEFFLFNDMFVQAAKTLAGKYQLRRKMPFDEYFSIVDLPDDDRERKNSVEGKQELDPSKDSDEDNSSDGKTNSKRRTCQFQVNSKEKSFVVIAPDQQSKVQWMEDIGEMVQAVTASRVNRPQLAGNDTTTNSTASVPAPVWKEDSSALHCSGPECERGFTFLNRRHHCRFCGGLFCGACSAQRVRGQRACLLCHSLLGEPEDIKAVAAERKRKGSTKKERKGSFRFPNRKESVKSVKRQDSAKQIRTPSGKDNATKEREASIKKERKASIKKARKASIKKERKASIKGTTKARKTSIKGTTKEKRKSLKVAKSSHNKDETTDKACKGGGAVIHLPKPSPSSKAGKTVPSPKSKSKSKTKKASKKGKQAKQSKEEWWQAKVEEQKREKDDIRMDERTPLTGDQAKQGCCVLL